MKSARLPQLVSRAGMVVVAAVLAAGTFPAAAATIDDFTTAQAQLSAPPSASSTVADAGILGGQRDLQLTIVSGAGPATVEVSAGLLQLDVTDTTPDTQGRSVVTWDGDADPDTLDPTGLGGVDLTTGDHTGFRLTVDAAGAGTEVVIEVYTDGANASKAALVLPEVLATTNFDLSFSTFAVSAGAGADFTDVGAITMSVTSVEQGVEIAMVETAGPAIGTGDALKIDTLVVDNDGDGMADPGDTLRYTITITNTGTEATSVDLADVIQPNLTLVGGSIVTDPIAAPDSYIACGNITLSVDGSPALPGMTANDHDPDQESFAITTTFPLVTDQGGNVDNVNPVTGTFDYVPPAGFRGVDTFTYDIEDASMRTSTATVTLMVDSLVWFVDNTVAPGGSGQQADPFMTLGEAEAESGPGDTIFVFAGAGDTGDGITLKDRQQLIGEGVGLNACGTQVVPPGSRPTLANPTSTVIRLASANRIAGLNIEPEGSEEAIVGSSVSGLEIDQVGIDTSRVGPFNGGVNLTDTTGAFIINQLTVSGTGTGVAFVVTGGDPEITVTSSSLTPAGGSLLSIAGTTGGFVDFQPSNTLSLAGGTGSAVSLQANAGVITLSSLGSVATTGGGLLIGGNSAVNLGAISSISATGGAALAISGSTVARIGGGPLTIDSLTSTASPGTGVTLSGVAPGLTVAGSTTVATSTGHGINLDGSNGPVSFNSVTIDQTGASGLVVSGNTASIGIAGGSIGGTTPPTGNAVDIDGGNGDITVAASINGAATARSVEVSDRSGGTVTFSGNVTDPGLGINLATNGAGTITFAGALDLDTSSYTAFNATGGGTVQTTGAGSTIDTTTGVGVNIVNTGIGASGLTFESISTSGPTNGIVLDTTGTSGGLTVTGNGPAGSGGTIQNAADAVSLTDTSSVTLTAMNLVTNSDSAITGSNVTDLVLDGVIVDSSGNAAGENSIDLSNLRGLNNAFTNITVTASLNAERAVLISNTVGTGTADVLTVTGSTFQDTYSSPVGADLMEISLSNSANLTATITSSTFDDGRTNGVQMLIGDTAEGGLDISGCTFTNQGIAIDMGVVGNGSLTFDVSANPNITARLGYGTTMVNLFTDDTASAVGRVKDNPNIAGGGSATSGTGIRFNINGDSNATVEANNNGISNFWFDLGIDAVARGGTGRLDATITNNVVTMDTSNSLYNIRTQAQDSNTVCANVANNTALGVGLAAYRERTSAATSTVYLEGFTTDAATTWTANGNTGAPVSSSDNGTLSAPPGAGSCATVP